MIHKFLRSIDPSPAADYRALIAAIDNELSKRTPLLGNEELVSAAVSLRDHLSHRRQDAPLAGNDKHHLDDTLETTFVGFGRYSEVIRSILRNAELTWQMPELFDDRVDKSTMVMELTKAIDIRCQETLGEQMFGSSSRSLLPAMLSRLASLDLGDIPRSQMVSELGCAGHFTTDTFPHHKMKTLVESLVSGRMRRDRYRLIDGARSWGILLLLFGRPFSFRGRRLDPLYAVHSSEAAGVNSLAARLNAVQDLRNRAAHWASLFPDKDLAEARRYSIRVLNDLEELIAPKCGD